MNCQKIIILFGPIMVRIVLPFSLSDKSSCSRCVVSVSHICIRDFFGKEFLNKLCGSVTTDYPEMMSESVLCYKIILRSLIPDNLLYNFIQFFYGRICKKNRFDIGVVRTDVHHPVLFLVRPGKLMFLNQSVFVIINRCTTDNTILCPASHGLGIYIICRLFILD